MCQFCDGKLEVGTYRFFAQHIGTMNSWSSLGRLSAPPHHYLHTHTDAHREHLLSKFSLLKLQGIFQSSSAESALWKQSSVLWDWSSFLRLCQAPLNSWCPTTHTLPGPSPQADQTCANFPESLAYSKPLPDIWSNHNTVTYNYSNHKFIMEFNWFSISTSISNVSWSHK